MRYISEIRAIPEGSVDKLKYDMTVDDPRYNAVLTDLETGSEELVDGKLVPYFNDVLGFSDCALPTSWVSITNTRKTAMLYKYVAEVGSAYPAPDLIGLEADFCVLYADAKSDHTGVNGGKRHLVVETINESIKVFGKLGSVGVRTANFSGVATVHTLYDLLGKLCRETHLNLMSYESIHFYSRPQQYRTKIKLLHTPESERYFMKMYLDVSRCS